MPRVYKKRELKDYPRELFIAWDQAVEGKLRVQFSARNTATNFKAQMNQFRKRFAEEGQDLGRSAAWYGCDLAVQEREGDFFVIRQDSEWKKQLREQIGRGVQVQAQRAPAEAAVSPPVAPGTPEPDNTGAALNDLGYGTGEQ